MNIKKLYYGLVSLISVVAISISLWISISSIAKIIFITDDEYLLNNKYQIKSCVYDIQRKYCSNLKNNFSCITNLDKNKDYLKNLEECENKKKKEILIKRIYNFKINLIWSWSTFVVFLVLFLFHYTKFKKFE